MSVSEAVKAITDEISNIFRHIVPGIIILGFAYKSHPAWFENLSFNNTMHIIFLVVVALAVGNFLYVSHRYTIHHLFDWLCYLYRERKWWGGYRQWLYKSNL
jgi:hypothetical protein